MKKFIIILASLSLIACKENSAVKKKETSILDKGNVVDEVGSSKRIDPFNKNYRSNDGMVEDIYKQLILNDKELIKLDTKIKDLRENSNEVIAEYNSVLSKSDNYYKDAFEKTKNFSDSLARAAMDSLTMKSFTNYEAKTKNVRSLITISENNLKRIDEIYATFKIKRTMAEIEKYQNNHAFDLKNLNNLINKQTQTLSELKQAK